MVREDSPRRKEINMKEIRDGFHDVIANLHRLTISSSALLKIAEKQKYRELHEKEHIDRALEAVGKSCDLAKITAEEVEKLRVKVYAVLNVERDKGE